MFFSSWIHRRSVKQAARPKRTARLTLEQLEDRCVPATFTVTLSGSTALPVTVNYAAATATGRGLRTRTRIAPIAVMIAATRNGHSSP